MNITQLTVSFKRTQSLPGYCNVSSGLTATAEIDEADDPLVVEQRLRNELEQAVNDWIDAALEQAGQPARYSTDPRYDLLWWRSAKLAVVAPHIPPLRQGDTLLSLPGDWGFHSGGDDDLCYTNQRLSNLQRMIREIGLSHVRVFASIDDVRSWTHSHLSVCGLWSIVNVSILDPASQWEHLGRVGIPGELYARMTTDPTLKIEPISMTGSVGICLSDIADKSILVIRTVDNARLWIQEQILKAHPPDEDDDGDEEIDE